MGIMDLNEIMDRGIDALRKHIKSIVLYSLCYGLIYAAGIVFLIFGGGIFVALSAALLSNAVIPVIFISIIAVIAGVMALASKIGIIKIASQDYCDANVSFGEALGASFKNLHKVLGILMIEILLFSPALLVFGTIIYFTGKGYDARMILNGISRRGETPLIILTILIILAFLFVILIYSTIFSFSLQAAVIEKLGAVQSVKRSFNLIRNNFWGIFGATLLFGLTIYAIESSLSSFFAGVFSLLFLLLKFLNLPLDYITFLNMTLTLTSWPLRILSWLVITPAGTILATLLYYNQRFKKEGYDMQIKLHGIEKIDERKQSGELV